MHATILLLVTIVALTQSHDVAIGLNNYGEKIFAENRQASPAIWRQKENVTIEAAENEVITKVIIIDMRPEKDGDASIVDGGEGKRNVTIELKSPTVLRGYDFHIEVFSAPDVSNNSAASEAEISSSIPPTSDCNHQTNANTEISQKISSSNDLPTKKEIDDKVRPVRTTNEENGDTNIEGSTLYTSLSTSSVTSVTPNANDKASTVIIDTTVKSIETTSIPDSNNKNGDNLPSLGRIESNETIPKDLVDKFSTTTLSDTTTEVTTEEAIKFENGKDVLDFPDLTGLNDDDSRHAREAKHEETSTVTDVTTEVTTEITTTLAPESSTISEIPDFPALSGIDGNDTRHPRRVNDDEVTTTIVYITEETTELITILSPESENTKAILDLAAISGIGTDGTTQNSDEEARSSEETTTEVVTEITTTIAPNNYENSDIPEDNTGIEDDMRHARETKDATNLKDTRKSVELPINSTESEDYSGDGEEEIGNAGLGGVLEKEEGTDGQNDPQFDITQTIPKLLFGQESDSINPLNSKGVFYNPLNIIGDTNDRNETETPQDSTTTPIINSQQPTNNTGEVLRNSRDAVNFSDIFGNNFGTDASVTAANYPVFVNPSIPSEGNEDPSDTEYVYIPLIAIVSKSSYPSFQDALQSLIQQTKIATQTPN